MVASSWTVCVSEGGVASTGTNGSGVKFLRRSSKSAVSNILEVQVDFDVLVAVKL